MTPSASSPVLRATTSSEEIWDDPSEDLLFMLLEDLAELDDEGSFVIVDRLDGGPDQYMQVLYEGRETIPCRNNPRPP